MEFEDRKIAEINDLGHDVYQKLSWFSQERVSSAKVMVVGCGALGNEVMKNLVLFGVEHLVIVDFDHVETGNLSRSILFTQDDAKKKRLKVEVAAERLRLINPSVEVYAIYGDIAYDVGLGLLRRMDVVIGCVDSRWARYCINRLCMRAGIPWVDGGIDALEGTVRVFAPGKNCYACNLGFEGLRELGKRMPCSGIIRRNESAGRAPTTPVVASVIGAVQTQEAMKLLHPEQLENGELTSLCGRVFYYEGQHLTTHTALFAAYDDDCPVHEQWRDIRQIGLSTESSVAEALQVFNRELDSSEVSISLVNDCFVDYVEDRISGAHSDMMCPGHMVATRIDMDGKMRTKPYSAFYQHEYRNIDSTFPYLHLSLGQLGIPAWDVLHVKTQKGDYYIEMKEERQNSFL